MPATTAQNAIAVVGIDIGKNSFDIVALDVRGAIVLRQKWSRISRLRAVLINRISSQLELGTPRPVACEAP